MKSEASGAVVPPGAEGPSGALGPGPYLARIRHAIPGRVRLGLTQKAAGDSAFLEHLRDRIAALPGVTQVEARPLTASLVVGFEGSLEGLSDSLAAQKLIRVMPPRMAPAFDPVSDFDTRIAAAELAVNRLTKGHAGLWDATFILLVMLGCLQLARGNVVGPAFTLFAQAATVAAVRRSRTLDAPDLLDPSA